MENGNERKNPKAYIAEQPLTKQMRLDGGQRKPALKKCTEESPSIALWSRRTAARYKVVHDFVSRNVTKFEAVLLQIMQTSAIEGRTINKIKSTPRVDHGRRHLEFHF